MTRREIFSVLFPPHLFLLLPLPLCLSAFLSLFSPVRYTRVNTFGGAALDFSLARLSLLGDPERYAERCRRILIYIYTVRTRHLLFSLQVFLLVSLFLRYPSPMLLLLFPRNVRLPLGKKETLLELFDSKAGRGVVVARQ